MAKATPAPVVPAHPDFVRLNLKEFSSWSSELLVPMTDIGEVIKLLSRCLLADKSSTNHGVECLTISPVMTGWESLNAQRAYIAASKAEAKEFVAAENATYELTPGEQQQYGVMVLDPEEFRAGYLKDATAKAESTTATE